jgi:chemotaxis protein methyltransferase CheR
MMTIAAQPRETTSFFDTEEIGLDEFGTIQGLMYDNVGIVLKESKRVLVEARVNRRLRQLKLRSYSDYVRLLNSADGPAELVHLIDAITTNVTHFFRESDHFDFLERQAAEWLDEGRRRFRFWSAGCSTGEEPYSLAMMLRRVRGMENADMRILATDVSTRVLQKAMAGTYRLSKVDVVPDRYRQNSFVPVSDTHASVSDALRRDVMYRRLNLNVTPYPIKGLFDAVLCRNVMIYFDRGLRERIVTEAHRLLALGGYLVVGHAETLIGMDCKFEFVQPSIYRKVNERSTPQQDRGHG